MSKNYKLNPEIKKQADKLFKLIEDEIKNHADDPVAYAMAEEWGDYLKRSRGYSMLKYAHELTQTKSERAWMDLEEAFYHMDDDAASTITDLYHYTLKVSEILDSGKKLNRDDLHSLGLMVREASKVAKEVEKQISTLWKWRATGYREELEELKKKLKEAA